MTQRSELFPLGGSKAFAPMAALLVSVLSAAPQIPADQWVLVRTDPVGARPGSAVRFVPEERSFFLWGHMNADYDLLQELPVMEIPEYDMVAFRLGSDRWENHFPKAWEAAWTKKLPLAFTARTYAGKTTGVERTVLRGASNSPEAPSRPDLNLVFDQVAYCPPRSSLFYFTGGLTATYDVRQRRWSDLKPEHSPPPVLGGSLVYNPKADEMLLCGGGYVVEEGPDGKAVGFSSCWSYDFAIRDWKKLDLPLIPPPRMNTRMVLDGRNQSIVMFGGDSHTHYLADTWIFNLVSRKWQRSSAPGPAGRAGHFTVFDAVSGLVLVGGGYNREDLTDLWAFDVAKDEWRRLPGEVPTGFYLSADIAPEERLILLVTSTKTPGDRKGCDPLYPVRKTYAFRVGDSATTLPEELAKSVGQPILKEEPGRSLPELSAEARQALRLKLQNLPPNQWVELPAGDQPAPVRTWGTATLDTDRSRILYWGGGHCGYEGNDVDAYALDEGRWQDIGTNPEFPQRMYNSGNGSRLGGITFGGNPWVIHGRRIYAYDPVSKKMILARAVRLTAGYEPALLKHYPKEEIDFEDALVKPPSSYVRYATWSLELNTGDWKLLGPTPLGLDTLVTTPHGVMGVDQHWRSMLNDWGYNRDWRPEDNPRPLQVFRLDESKGNWIRVGGGIPAPQNLYEQISLVYDSKRDRLLLHGGGEKRDELWEFSLKERVWTPLQPSVQGAGLAPPECSREAVYIPEQDVLLTPSLDGQLWVYEPGPNAWKKLQDPGLSGVEALKTLSHNRGLVYDQAHHLVLLAGGRRNDGGASVWALRFKKDTAR